MEVDYICKFIKYIGINISFAICFFRIIHCCQKTTLKEKIIIIITSIILGFIQCYATKYIPSLFQDFFLG